VSREKHAPHPRVGQENIMVQLKYFGDSRDFFKYDLITSILDGLKMDNYVFIPMLTNHRIDNEGNKSPKMIGGKSQELLSFIAGCNSKSLCHWEHWLRNYAKNYKTIEPVDEKMFDDLTRDAYWTSFSDYLKEKNALIFLDPDTGLESGGQPYLQKMGREKYILNHETDFLYRNLDTSSILMIYQHLPNNKHIHEKSVDKKIAQLQTASGSTFVCAYREDDLAFLFAAKNDVVFHKLCKVLSAYHDKSHHKYKSKHNTNNRVHSDAPNGGA